MPEFITKDKNAQFHDAWIFRSGGGATGPSIIAPDDLPVSYRTNGGYWLAENQTTSVGKVTAWTDEWGVRDLVQATASFQPDAGTSGGYPAAIWPINTLNECGLSAAADFSPAWWMLIMQFRDGLDATFETFNSFIGERLNTTMRVMGDSGLSTLFASNVSASTASINGGPETATVLPLPRSAVAITPTVSAAQWGIGPPSFSTRGWQGPVFGAIALGTVPTSAEKAGLLAWATDKWGL